MIRQKRNCPICNKDVEITSIVADGEGNFREILSCTHTFKFANPHLDEAISISDMVKGEVVHVSTIAEAVPVTVSGASGIPQFASFSGFQGLINNTGQIIIDKLVIYSSQHTEHTTTTTTTNIDYMIYSLTLTKVITLQNRRK